MKYRALMTSIALLAVSGFADAAQVPDNAGQDGLNLRPALLGESQDGREYVIQEALSQIAPEKATGQKELDKKQLGF